MQAIILAVVLTTFAKLFTKIRNKKQNTPICYFSSDLQFPGEFTWCRCPSVLVIGR